MGVALDDLEVAQGSVRLRRAPAAGHRREGRRRDAQAGQALHRLGLAGHHDEGRRPDDLAGRRLPDVRLGDAAGRGRGGHGDGLRPGDTAGLRDRCGQGDQPDGRRGPGAGWRGDGPRLRPLRAAHRRQGLPHGSLAFYLVPTPLDVPEIECLIVEVPDPNGPYGAKGVSEPATIPTTPAILNAIYDAVGMRVTRRRRHRNGSSICSANWTATGDAVAERCETSETVTAMRPL